jgi:gliding motility-associated-like protein
MKMKCLKTICFPVFWGALFLLPQVHSGQNLISNPGFEAFQALPQLPGQCALALSWFNPGGGEAFPHPSPDYLHAAAQEAGVALPMTAFGRIAPKEGQAVMGTALWARSRPDFREYIAQELAEPLVPGQSYRFSFFVTNGDAGAGLAGGCGISSLGVWFSIEAPLQEGSAPIEAEPQWEAEEVLFEADWKKVTFSFVADQPYRYFTIGNFRDDRHTFVRYEETRPYPGAYYFFDDFSLKAAKEEEVGEAPAAPRAASPAIETAEAGAENAQVESCPVFIPNIFSPDGNGVNDRWEVYPGCAPLALRAEVFDRAGLLVFSSTELQPEWDGAQGGNPLPEGVYIYRVEVTMPDEGSGMRSLRYTGSLTLVR